MTLKQIREYIVGDFRICVDEAKGDEFECIDNFDSDNKEKMELYKDAELTLIMPCNNDSVLIEVCIDS
jgi:hypothetical protein